MLSIYRTHPNGWGANNIVRWSHRCPWKTIAHLLQVFFAHTRFVVGDETRICFWEDLWWGDQPFSLWFSRLFRVTTTKNLPISAILGNNTSLSWDFTFRCNLFDVEFVDFERLLSLLYSVYLYPFVLDVKTWVPSSLGAFSINSFFLTLSNFSNSIPFYLVNFLWKSKVSSKVRAFAWLVAHKKVSTNDMLQLRRPFKAFSPDWCILYRGSSEMIDHLFLRCPITLGLWHRSFLRWWWGGFSQAIFAIWWWSP